jgi:predicted TIM-barrel fold metal-dependent hydrolase
LRIVGEAVDNAVWRKAVEQHDAMIARVSELASRLPFFMQRVDEMPVELTRLKRPVSANLRYTFAGFNFPATFLDLLLEIGVSRTMFSADYPYARWSRHARFWNRFRFLPPTVR